MKNIAILSREESINLDFFRAGSAITVCFCHFFQLYIAKFNMNMFYLLGLFSQASVMIFFVLSGFLIAKSIVNNIGKNGYFSAGDFFLSRITRIYPPLFISIIVMITTCYLSPHFFDSGSTRLLFHGASIPKTYNMEFNERIAFGILTFTSWFSSPATTSNPALWSLPIEVWYYVVIGLMTCKPPLLKVSGVVVFLLCSLNNTLFFHYSIVWVSGVFVAILHSNCFQKRWLNSIFSFSSLLMLSFASYYGYKYVTEHTLSFIVNYNIFFGLFFCALIPFILNLKALRLNALHKASRYSYSLYVIHMPILMFLYGCFEKRLQSSLLLSVAVGAVALLISLFISERTSRITENKSALKRIFT